MATVDALVDASTFDAAGRIGLTYRRVRGVRVVLEWCARIILTPRDGLPWEFGRGIDLAGYVNAALSPQQLQQLRVVCDAEIAKIDFVAGVRSSMTLVDGVLKYQVGVNVIGEGTFPLAVSIDKAAQVLVQFPIAA